MLKIEKYGAIDIGSNAIRLLVSTVIEQKEGPTLFKKTSLVRVPIRLGEDVFLDGTISLRNASRLIDAMNAFRLLMNTHNITRYRACATSAMREAANSAEVVAIIEEKTGIKINIIDGEAEAAIIASTDLNSLIQNDRVFLYVDVGGGSTELSVFENGKKIASHSFPIGTVRLLNDIVKDEMWDDMKDWIRKQTKDFKKINVIGSGGNINSIFKHSGKKMGMPLSYFYLVSFYELVKSYSNDERIIELDMNPDRADVIESATRIYLSAMKWSRAKNIYVPKIGLSDGIIKSLYNEKIAEEIAVD
ncbi:MAG: exopolyphosphatase/guanosine-5'-triphosphate,3'-diphosphate pyrophosphatase [Sediminicola sp.]